MTRKSGRMDVLSKRFNSSRTLEKEESEPENYLRRCIKSTTDISDEEIDDIMLCIDGVPIDDLQVIKRFVCLSGPCFRAWKDIALMYDTWLKTKSPPRLVFRFSSRKVLIDERLEAMARIHQRNEERQSR